MNYMELDWDEKLTPTDFQRIAAFSGPAGFDELETTLENEKVVAVNHHVKVHAFECACAFEGAFSFGRACFAHCYYVC